MKPEQLELLTTVSAPSISPDGTRAVVSASRPNFGTDSYTGQLWQVELDQSRPPRRLTRGEADSQPQYSPDGSTIAFLRADSKGVSQLAIVEASGGEPMLLTDRLLGVGSFSWAPDGTEIALISRTPEPGRYGSTQGVGPGAEAPRHISTLNYRGDGVGFTHDKIQELFTLSVPKLGGEPFIAPRGRAAEKEGTAPDGLPTLTKRATAQNDVNDQCFSPDGAWIYFAAALHPGHDGDLRTQIYRVPSHGEADTGPESVLGTADSTWTYRAPRFSNDGSTLFVLGQHVGSSGVDFLAKQTAVCSVAAQAVAQSEAVVHTDIEVVDYTECDALVPHGPTGVLALARVRGTGELHLITKTGNNSVLVQGQIFIHAAAARADVVLVSHSLVSSPGECSIVEGEHLRQLTGFAAELKRETIFSAPVEATFNAPDGYPVHGWIHLPQGPGPHPVLLNIHGGPFSQYGPSYFDETQVYTAAGYAVLQCNPRGSAGYGRDHGLAIRQAMGTLDKDDVLAFLDGACAADPALDADRVGILGGSYGGYLTAFTIAHEHRFAAAMVERGFLDPASFVGTSDIGWFFADAYTGSDPAAIAAQSPMAALENVRTPTLIMHSEGDYRCPLEQAQRYYVGLKQLGVNTEFVLFPGESHGLSRAGTPWHRRQRFEEILAWFARFLPVSAAAETTSVSLEV